MHTVFMVAEKPSLAESISKLLSHGRNTSKKGFNGACSVHEWSGTFRNERASFRMTSVCGHVMAVDFPSRYNNWDKVDPIELFVAPIEKKEANPKLRMVEFLRHEAKYADILVLWLDCDKEGENICFEVIDCVQSVMNKPKQILRAHFSAVTDKEINTAMNNLRQPNLNESLSVDARQELDLRIGCAFTRFQTKFFQGKYGDLNSNLVSYGPCQTPTLGFCVKRHDLMQSFKPEPFWQIMATVNCEFGTSFNVNWNRGRLFDKQVATIFFNKVKSAKTAVVKEILIKRKTETRPHGLNTVEMLRVASSGLGIGPHNAMAIAERLYTSGYINYPRTETTAYPATFDLRGLLEKQVRSPDWGSVVENLLRNGINSPRPGHDAGDHPPIAPMRLATSNELGHEAFKLYEFIAQNFIASLMPDCHYEATQIVLSIGDGELFTLTANRIIDPGFTAILPWKSIKENILPDKSFVKGSSLSLASEPTLVEGKTAPPDYLTEADLITAMEKHGIGTDASIPTHIENIVQRAYVELIPGRKLKPTPLGIVLVHGYQAIDSELVLPHMRKAIEEQLNHIASGSGQFDAVLKYVIALFTAKYRYFVQHIVGMDQLFEVSFTNLADSGKPFSRCGKCRRYMKLIDSRPQRLHCPICNETYSVPQNGIIRPYKSEKCPLDDFELAFWSQNSNEKSMIFCPYCYSNPPFETMNKASGCDRCPHPTCPQSYETRGVDACLDCPHGIMVLCDSNAPKYRLNCNRCPTFIAVSQTIKSISVTKNSCAQCTAMHLDIKFNEDKLKSSNIADIGSSFCGCVFCLEVVCKLFTIVRKSQSVCNSKQNRPGRGRGRSGNMSRPTRRAVRVH